ncbi:MAG: hypothetical protein WCW02_01660 [Candidatus Buchananbacteria bacterium]
MFNFCSVVNLLFIGLYNLVAVIVKMFGHEETATKIRKRAVRCRKKIEFYEGEGPYPEKEKV